MPDSLFQWGTDLIIRVQSLRNPFLDGLFTLVTSMGEEFFFLLFLPAVLWCVSRDAGLRLGVLLFLNDCTNGLLKETFNAPRPDDPRITVLREETSPGFPSGHAQNATVLWGYLATQFRRPLTWALAVVLPLAIGLSRIYLGVHYPHDVIGGWLIGAVILVLFLLGTAIVRQINIGPGITLLFAVLVPLIILSLSQGSGAVRVAGLILGLGTGAVLERRLVRFAAGGGPGTQAAKLGVGLGTMFALYLGMYALFPATDAFRFVRYAILGLWVTFATPWLFVRLGLAPRE